MLLEFHAAVPSMVRSGPHRALRAGTSPGHQRMDSVFSRYDLSDRGRYHDFLRVLTGSDRVMIYRFDLDGAGEIVAEAEAYLGSRKDRIVLTGQELLPLPAAVATLAPVFRELVISAATYGALVDGPALVVEDNTIIALDTEEMLARLGAASVVMAGSVAHAVPAVERTPAPCGGGTRGGRATLTPHNQMESNP
jgi:hypothetical protein